MDENVRMRAIQRAAESERAAAKKLAREARIAAESSKRKRAPNRIFLSEDDRRQGMLEYDRKRRQTPEYKEMRKRISERAKALNAPIVAARKAERDAKKAIELAGKEDRRLAREAAAEERKRTLELKPKVKRVRLTDEQRREAKREEKRNCKHRRRCRLRDQESKATPKQIAELRKLAKGRCFYCKTKVAALTLDHVIPVAKGGTHTLDNIVFACPACNSDKRDLPPHEYAQKHGMLLV